MKLQVYKFGTKTKSADFELSKAVFGAEIDNDAILETIRWQRAKRRAGTADVKNRSEIKSSTRKIVRQKGSGGARHGARSAPIFVGGGVVFGPTPRSYEFKLNKKFRQRALRSALSMKHSKGVVHLVDDFAVNKASLKEAKSALSNHVEQGSILLIGVEFSENLKRSVNNLHQVKILPAKAVNVYDLMKYDTVLMSSDAVKDIQERLDV